MGDVGRAPTIREHLSLAESYTSRSATERPYMSPEERLARCEEHAVAALALLDEAVTKLRKGSYNGTPQDAIAHAIFLLVPDPSVPRGDADACAHDWQHAVFGGTDGWQCSKCGAIR